MVPGTGAWKLMARVASRIAVTARKYFWAEAGGARKRLSSRRSPAMVRIGKPTHQRLTCSGAAPASQAALPTAQQLAAMASTAVNIARWRAYTCQEEALRIRLASRYCRTG